jgi:hypothetical protein
VWCTLSAGIVGPFFFNNIVTADHYLHVLLEKFLQRMGVSFEETFFQQDGAQPHTANAVLDVLNENFDSRVLYNYFVISSDMGGPGHHSLQILTHAIISHGAFCKIQFTKNICT